MTSNNNHGKHRGVSPGSANRLAKKAGSSQRLRKHCLYQSRPDERMKGHDKLCRILNSFRGIEKATRVWRDAPGDQMAIRVVKVEEKVDSVQF
jgi:hypothetical protein